MRYIGSHGHFWGGGDGGGCGGGRRCHRWRGGCPPAAEKHLHLPRQWLWRPRPLLPCPSLRNMSDGRVGVRHALGRYKGGRMRRWRDARVPLPACAWEDGSPLEEHKERPQAFAGGGCGDRGGGGRDGGGGVQHRTFAGTRGDVP